MPLDLKTSPQVRFDSAKEALKAFTDKIPQDVAYTLQEVADMLHHHPDTIRRESHAIGARMRVYIDGKSAYVVANPKTVKERLNDQAKA